MKIKVQQVTNTAFISAFSKMMGASLPYIEYRNMKLNKEAIEKENNTYQEARKKLILQYTREHPNNPGNPLTTEPDENGISTVIFEKEENKIAAEKAVMEMNNKVIEVDIKKMPHKFFESMPLSFQEWESVEFMLQLDAEETESATHANDPNMEKKTNSSE